VLKYCVSLVAVAGFAVYCVYAILFFAWAATAPADPAIHEQARFLSRAWSAGLFGCFAAGVALLWRIIYLCRDRITHEKQND
jgi:hypothetical protein